MALSTGLRITLVVTPPAAGTPPAAQDPAQGAAPQAQVRLAGMAVEPLLLERRAAAFPEDLNSVPGWNGELTVLCTVDTAGLCSRFRLAAGPAVPESARRWAQATMAMWRWQPQRHDGQPVEAEVAQRFVLRTPDDLPQEFRFKGQGQGLAPRR